MWHGLVPDDLLPSVIGELPVRSWPSARLVSHAMHAAVDALALTPEGMLKVLLLIGAGGCTAGSDTTTAGGHTQLLIWIHAEDDDLTIRLARAHFGLGPRQTDASLVTPFARLTCDLAMDLMQYAAQSRDTRTISHGGDGFADNRKIVTTPEDVDEYLMSTVMSMGDFAIGRLADGHGSEWDGRMIKVNPWTGRDVKGKWPGRAPVPDKDLWQILRWVMRRMTPEYEFASFYFEFIPSVLGPHQGRCTGQIAPLLWQRKH